MMKSTRSRLSKSIVLALATGLGLAACSGEEEKPRTRADSQAVSVSAQSKKWGFIDAFAALKDRDPARRLEAVEWIGAHLSTHPVLAKDALRAATADDDQEVASVAKRHLQALGERR